MYMFIFAYLQISSYTEYFPIEAFHDGPSIENADEILVSQEQIEVSEGFKEELTNVSRDMNDSRERSSEEFYENQSAQDIEQAVKDYEKQIQESTGGEQERQKIIAEIERLKELEKEKTSAKPDKAKRGGDKAAAGNVMVEWSLEDRLPHQEDNYWVRNPGYTCGFGSNGVVTVEIKVNQTGSVTSAEFSPLKSNGANPCMIEQAVKYAKLSRFKYSANAPKIQAGVIVYRFASQ